MEAPSRRGPLIATACSLVVWIVWFFAHGQRHPYNDFSGGIFTDHFSHMNAARAFPRVGTNIWRKPIARLFRPLTPEELDALPEDVHAAASSELRFVPGWPAGKPMVASWSHNPRPYPPGDMVLVAPIALAYHFTSLTFAGATRLLILLFLVYAHFSIYFVLRATLRRDGTEIAVPLFMLFLVYPEIIYWTLEGFYDAATIAPLVASAYFLREKRGLPAIASFCLASVIHFRALFFAPFAIYGLVLVVRQKQWQKWGRLDYALAALTLLLAFATLYPFVLLLPTLRSLPVTNPIGLGAMEVEGPKVIVFVVAALATAGAFVWCRAWLELVMLGWISFMCASLREVHPWHGVVLLAWPAAAITTADPSRVARIRNAKTVFLVLASVAVFRYVPLPLWVRRLF